MINLNKEDLLKYIEEDYPYMDLTTSLQEIDENKKVKLEVYTRTDVIVSCTEEAKQIVEMMNCKVESYIASKSFAKKDTVLMTYTGSYNNVNKILKVAQVLLEYACKISTYTNSMVSQIKEVNNHCALLTSRKTFPLSKKLCLKAIVDGGGAPHRFNLSDSVLFFDYHRKVYSSNEEFYNKIKSFKTKLPEKKIVIESDGLEDSKKLMINGADVIQTDKISKELLKEITIYRDNNFPNVKILAAGGINNKNVKDFAETGVDGIVTSSAYSCGMANIGCKFTLLK